MTKSFTLIGVKVNCILLQLLLSPPTPVLHNFQRKNTASSENGDAETALLLLRICMLSLNLGSAGKVSFLWSSVGPKGLPSIGVRFRSA